MAVGPFATTLKANGIDLVRGETHTLQINVGLVCNQRCRHCHLEAGPERRESMSVRPCTRWWILPGGGL